MKRKVLFIITGLNVAGAEMMLYKICSQINREQFDVYVISLTNFDILGERISKLDIAVCSLNMPLGRFKLSAMLKLHNKIKEIKPDIVQTWLYHADLIGGVMAKFAGVKHIYWNIRNSDLSKKKTKLHTRLTVKVCALLSKVIPDKILCNSYHAMDIHSQQGYDNKKFIIVPNGFDLEKFKPCSSCRDSVRDELGIDVKTKLIGMVGRFDPQKNHQGFFEAAEKVLAVSSSVHFLLIGKNVDYQNKALVELLDKSKYSDNYHLLGLRSDIPRLTAAFDVSTLTSSWGEAFPNAIGEAMACGIPCVATDVGDSKRIIADTGIVTGVNDTEALAKAWLKLLNLNYSRREELSLKAIKRIKDNFSLQEITKKYEQIYLQ